MSKFKQKLASLGFDSYAAYLRSELWIDFKKRYAAGGRAMACAVCGRNRVCLHHHTYVRIGCEDFDDVVPLCRGHHQAVHQEIEANTAGMRFSRAAVAILKSRHAEIRRKSQRSKPSNNSRKMSKELKRLTIPEVLSVLKKMQLTINQKTAVVRLYSASDAQGMRSLVHDIILRQSSLKRAVERAKRREKRDRERAMDDNLSSRLSRES